MLIWQGYRPVSLPQFSQTFKPMTFRKLGCYKDVYGKWIARVQQCGNSCQKRTSCKKIPSDRVICDQNNKNMAMGKITFFSDLIIKGDKHKSDVPYLGFLMHLRCFFFSWCCWRTFWLSQFSDTCNILTVWMFIL